MAFWRRREVIPIKSVWSDQYQRLLNPAGNTARISGVRVHDVGQGDAISVLDQHGYPFFQIDYGGRAGNLRDNPMAARVPLRDHSMLMLSHWDEDHWCSAQSSPCAQGATWLVPRQRTSPSAVKFSLTLDDIYCVPEDTVGTAQAFQTKEGDRIIWEKLERMPEPPAREDCNRTGLAFSVVRKGDAPHRDRVILLPGDAPFGRVPHYWDHAQEGRALTGLVAFHHGSRNHLDRATEILMRSWVDAANPLRVVFSCSEMNSYGHPDAKFYSKLPFVTEFIETKELRANNVSYVDLLF